jgi:hypothetical protein
MKIHVNFKLNAEQALMQLTQLAECTGHEEQAKGILKRDQTPVTPLSLSV